MKAIVVREFGGPDVMKMEDVPEPAAGPGQILIRVRAVGVNPVDSYIRSGTYARKPELPYTPHADIAGVVETVGAGVTKVKPGDRVYAYMTAGGAEFALAEEWQVQRLPDRVSFQQGAAIGVPYATAWRALFFKAKARAGETVLVHGASGGVGVAAVQLARAHGMQVIGTAGTDEGMRLVRDQGAHHVLNHREPDYVQQMIPSLTGGRGPDVILEMLANVNLDRDLDMLARHGRIAIIGNRGRVEIDPRKMMGKDGSMVGMTLFNTTREEFAEIHAGVVAGLENGTLNPVIGKEMRLDQAPQAHVAVMEPGAFGKIVLIP